MGKRQEMTNSAAQLAARLADDPSIEREVELHRQETRLVSMLVEQRIHRGLRQKDIAAKMGVSESTVSRLEDSRDGDLRLSDILAYASALGLDLSLFLENPRLPAAEQIKHCVFRISDLLEKLTALARECQDDPAIFDGIKRFQGEVLFNFLLGHAKNSIGSPVKINYPPEDAGHSKSMQNPPTSRAEATRR